MAGFLDIFKGLMGGDPIQSLSGLIDQFHLSPDESAKIKQAAAELELKREEIEAARDQALAAIQGENIRAETTSSDAYVRRARPTFLYMMIAAIGVDLVVFPLLGFAAGQGLKIVEIPAGYLELFGVAFLGYTGARTWEKVQGVGK
jgi:holin (3TMs family)